MPIGEYETFELAELAANHRAQECGGDVVIHDSEDGRLGTAAGDRDEAKGPVRGHAASDPIPVRDPSESVREIQGGL